MRENEFIAQLEKRSEEQEKLMRTMPLFFYKISVVLGKNPWNSIIPLAILITISFRLVLGTSYFEFILWIFGGL